MANNRELLVEPLCFYFSEVLFWRSEVIVVRTSCWWRKLVCLESKSHPKNVLLYIIIIIIQQPFIKGSIKSMDTAEAATAQRPIKNEVIFLQNFKPQFTCQCLSDKITLGNVRTIHTIQCKSVLKNDHFFHCRKLPEICNLWVDLLLKMEKEVALSDFHSSLPVVEDLKGYHVVCDGLY